MGINGTQKAGPSPLNSEQSDNPTTASNNVTDQ